MSLNVVDPSNESSRSIKVIEEVAPLVSDNNIYRSSSQSFFVESTNGDLLMVYRSQCGMNECPTYNIFKIVETKGKLDHIPITNLDGHSLFLDDNQSISVLASIYPGCTPNSIYYLHYYNPFTQGGVSKFEEFDLEDQSVQEYSEVEDGRKFLTWILPSMKLPKSLLY